MSPTICFIRRAPLRSRGPGRTSGRAAAPAGCPRRGCPPRRARRPARSTATPRPCACAPRAQAALAPVQRQRHARRRLDLEAREAAHGLLVVRLQAHVDVLAPRVQRAREPVPRARRAGSASSPGATPASRRTAARRSPSRGGGEIVTASIFRRSPRHCGGSNVAAMRSRQGVERSQARSTTYARSARCCARRERIGRRPARRPSPAGRLAEAQERVDRLLVAVRRPDDRREVGDDERVDDRVEVLEVLVAARDEDRLAGQANWPGFGSAGAAIIATASSDVAPGFDRAHDGARRVVAPDASQPVGDLAAVLTVDDRDEVQHPRGDVALVLAGGSPPAARAAPPRSRRASCPSPRQTLSVGRH